MDARWREVLCLRQQADDYARKNDFLAAALLDSQASDLAKAIREAESLGVGAT